jgi:hypothetical protein
VKNVAILYYIPLTLQLAQMGGERFNFPMFRKDLSIFRGVDNIIEFDIKDSFRIPVTMLQHNLKCIVTNPYNQELMLVKYLYNKDDTKGIYELRLTPGDIQTWSAGTYNFCVVATDINGIETIFYTTQDQDVTGTFQLIDKPFPAFVPSHLVRSEDFTMVNYNNLAAIVNQTYNTPNPITITFITSRFSGGAQKNLSSGLATFSILLNNFTAKFYVQGNLEENPITEDGWFNIPVDPITDGDHIDFKNAHGIHVHNFEGNYNWLRFKYEIILYNYGSVEKIWLKI